MRARARAMLLSALVLATPMSIAARASDTQTFKRVGEGYEVQFPAACTVEQSESRLTATCPAYIQPSLVDRGSLNEPFVLEVVTTPLPNVDLTLPNEPMVKEMAQVACGPAPERTSVARVTLAFSIERWPAFEGFVRCTPGTTPGDDKVFSFMRFAAGPRMAYWLYTRASARTKDAAATTAFQTFFLSFKPLTE